MKAIEREQFGMRAQRQRQHEHVAVDAAGRKRQQAGHRDRHHEQIDEDEIDRKQPGGAADLGLAVVLDDGDVELPRQQHDREQRQHRHGGECRAGGDARQHSRRLRLLQRAGEQRERPVEHHESHEDADREKGDELDDRFGRDRQHQPVLMLGGVDVAGAEQHRECRHRQRDEERDVAEQRLRARRPPRPAARMVATDDDTALSCSAI